MHGLPPFGRPGPWHTGRIIGFLWSGVRIPGIVRFEEDTGLPRIVRSMVRNAGTMSGVPRLPCAGGEAPPASATRRYFIASHHLCCRGAEPAKQQHGLRPFGPPGLWHTRAYSVVRGRQGPRGRPLGPRIVRAGPISVLPAYPCCPVSSGSSRIFPAPRPRLRPG